MALPLKPDDSFRVTYLVRATPEDIAARADALALEQTVELPRGIAARDPWVAGHVLGTVEAIQPAGEDLHRVTIAQPLATVGDNPAQLLNVLFGNASLQPDVTLADVDLPDAAFAWLPGPRVGSAGIRELVGVQGRPLLSAALKPMGLPPERLAELCGLFARAGIDVIKDDHGLADHRFCPFEARVEACLRATEDAGHDAERIPLYVPNLIGTPDTIARQLEFARAAGARMVLISPMVTGLPLLAQLAVEAAGLPLLAHPAFAGVLRADEPALLGKLFRWFGADAVIFPHTGGRFSYSLETCRRLAHILREQQTCARPSFPVPAGGITVERVPELLRFYGPDTILLLGSSLYEAGGALFERTRALVNQVARASTEAVG